MTLQVFYSPYNLHSGATLFHSLYLTSMFLSEKTTHSMMESAELIDGGYRRGWGEGGYKFCGLIASHNDRSLRFVISWSFFSRSVYNTLFTTLPILTFGAMEQNYPKKELLAEPELYREMTRNRSMCIPALSVLSAPLFYNWAPCSLRTFELLQVHVPDCVFLLVTTWGLPRRCVILHGIWVRRLR